MFLDVLVCLSVCVNDYSKTKLCILYIFYVGGT